jgi:DNA-binding NtrC family response regulator
MIDANGIAGDQIVGETLAVRRLRELALRVAPSRVPVLIQGPTGSGKELVAQALHTASRRSGPFVAFNVCAIAESMFEDTLFGHVRGAFTGAVGEARGYLAEAHHGTLFLDEISGLTLASQAKLLRAIETREFRPVGARADRTSDFRVVAATNEDLDTLVDAGRFRPDLLYRLRGVSIEVPPLRDRSADIPLLADHFAQQMAPVGKRIEIRPEALAMLEGHGWPGNVRELRQAIECAVALGDGKVLGRDEVAAALQQVHSHRLNIGPDELARAWLREVLEGHEWNTARAAAELGIHRATLYRRMQRLGLRLREERLYATR